MTFNNPLDPVTHLHHQLARAHTGTGIAQSAGVLMSASNFVGHLGEEPVFLTVLWALMVPAWAFVAIWSFRTARTYRHVARTTFSPIPNRNHETEGFDK